MKKLSYGLLLSLLFILNIGVVSAASCNKTTTIGEESETVIMTIYYTPSTTGYITERETVYKFGMGYAFCRNAGLKASNTNFKCTREIASTTGTEAIDAGVMAIISEYRKGNYDYYTTMTALRMYDNYFSSINKNTSGLSNLSTDDSDYASDDKYKYHVAWNLAYAYLADQAINSVKSELTRLKNAGISVKSSVSSKYSTIQVTNVEFVSAYSYIASGSVELLKIGLSKAADVAEDGVDTAVTVEATELDVDTSSSNGTYKAVVSLKISYSGYSSLDEDDQILKLNYTDDFTTSSTSTVTMHLKSVDGVEYTNDTNVFEYTEAGISADEDGYFNLYIVYEFEDSSICTSGNDINYKLEFSYPASENNYDFSVYEMYGCDGDGCQYFYVIDDLGDSGNNSNSDDDELTTDDLEGSFSPCGSTCEVLEQECTDSGDENSDACQQYKQECDNSDECTTYFSDAACSTSTTELVIKEGVEGSLTTSCQVTETLNVLQCVIDGEDLAGNSYETDLVSSNYCKVYCAEEYHITLPGQEATTTGRYFTLSAKIVGYRGCYTSEINTTQFESDLDDALQDIYDAYDEWAYYKVLSELNVNSYNDTKNVEGYYNCLKIGNSWPDDYFLQYWWYLYSIDNYSNWTDNAIQNYYGDSTYYSKQYNTTYSMTSDGSGFCARSKIFKSTGSYQIFDTSIAGTYYVNHANERVNINMVFGDGDMSCGDGDSYSCTLSTTSPRSDYLSKKNSVGGYDDKLDQAVDKLNTAIETYLTLVNQYNACSGANVIQYTTSDTTMSSSTYAQGWKMSDKLLDSVSVSFWYQEEYMNDVYTNNLITNSSENSTNVVDQTYYTCSVDDDYDSCASGSDGSARNLSSINSNDYETITDRLCYATNSSHTEFACSTSAKDIKVSTVKYVKQEVSETKEYITPTQFFTIYSTGAIVVVDPESGVTSSSIDNSEALDNGLPIGLGTKIGYYAYTLQVSGLGYYTNETDTGRIWGNANSVVVKAASVYKEVCYNDFDLYSNYSTGSTTLSNGVYVCGYSVNCKDGYECPDETGGGGKDLDIPTCTPPDCPDIITNTIYRPVSTSNINPNDRVLGSNWNYAGTSSGSSSSTTTDINSITSVSTALQLKAYVTTLKIYNEGESVYDLDENNVNLGGEGNGGKYVLTVTMDSEMTSWIKKYNEAAGDYVLGADVSDWTSTGESTLSCYDYYAVDGVLYENIFCYSSFLDDLFAKFDTNDGNDRIAGTNSRPTIDQRTNSTSYVGTDTYSYWTTFDSYLSDNNGYWTKVITSYEVSNYTSYDSEIGIGPSWK